MKTVLRFTLILILAIGIMPGCAYLPPKAGTAPTLLQVQLSSDLQSVANEIRKSEDSGWTPAQFDADLSALALVLPSLTPYLSGAELAYAGLYEAGELSVPKLEALATRYDE